MESIVENKNVTYNKAKIWQIGAFALNNTATNAFMFLMMNVAYFATGIVGLGTVIVSTLITGSRIWDGITDPIIGLCIDKTNGKFGKFRPFMFAGWLTMTIITLLIFFTNHKVPQGVRLPYFILLYAVYIIGYTFQTACTKAGQSVITNDPDQRPLFSTFDLSYTSLFFAGIAIYLSNYLVPKHGGFTEALFHEYTLTTIAFAGILTALAIAGIWSKDRLEFFGNTGKAQKIKLKDMISIIKRNKPLRMLIIAACIDKLGALAASNTIVMVMLFGIVIGNFGLYGLMSAYTMIPCLIIVYFGTRIARKKGTKNAFIFSTWLCIITFALMFLLLWLGDPRQISLKNINLYTITFLVLYIFGTSVKNIAGGLVIPMIPDVTDYELYANNRYAPGLVGTIFSFVDKIISSFGQTIIGVVLATIGFKNKFPDVKTPYTPQLFWATMFLFIGLMMIMWILSLIAMKHYELDDKRMIEIQAELSKRKAEAIK